MKMNKVKRWYAENKEKPLFKAKLLAAFLAVVVFAMQICSTVQEKRKAEETEKGTSVSEEVPEETEKDTLMVFYENSRAHIVVFIGLTAALAAVKCRKKQKLKESGDMK